MSNTYFILKYTLCIHSNKYCKNYMHSALLSTHTHTHSYTHIIMVSSDITVSYFKGFSSEHSHGWYLEKPPRVLELSTHTHIGTYSYTHSLALQQKNTDWSQCRATERRSQKLKKETGREATFLAPFREYI